MIDVVDTGIGIAKDRIAGLFEKFTVAEDFSTSKYGGTGLGLALSQRLCKLMGGDILVESDLGEGSCFTIRMPLLPAVSRENPDTAMTVADVPAGSIVPALDPAGNAQRSVTRAQPVIGRGSWQKQI